MKKLSKEDIPILFSPTHYVITKKSGSEFIWSYKLYKYLSKYFVNSKFVTGGSDESFHGLVNLKIFNPSKINLNMINVFKFHLMTQFITLKMAFNKKILFHILPFSIGTSVNLLFLLPFIKGKKVIGPIQLPLTVQDTDMDISDARGFGNKKNSIDLFMIIFQLIKPILKKLNLATLKNADALIVISSLVKDKLIEMGIEDKKIKIIPVGIDIDDYISKKNNEKYKEFTIISTSYLLKRKNIDQIVFAVKKLIDQKYKVRFLIVGDGPQKNSLFKLVEELGLSKYIEFVGFVDNDKLIDFYHKSHCFVSMSVSESWGQVYLEAMASGLPIITSINNGSKVIVEDNINGYLVPQKDIDMLFDKLKLLIENKNLCDKFSKNSVQKVRERYDWKKVIIPKYIELIASLI